VPDLVTHLASGYVAALPVWRRRRARLLLLAGTLLPDLATRPLNILVPQAGRFTEPLHTPAGYAVLCWLLAQAFDERRVRRGAFAALFAGGLVHFALDALQSHAGEGYWWLFPVSWASYSQGLFWPDACLKWIPLWALLIAGIELAERRRARLAARA
jgi:LexA-binding, inner membrane-associated putative hydrolase